MVAVGVGATSISRGVWAASQSWKRLGNKSPPPPTPASRRNTTWPTRQTSGLQDCKIVNLCCLRHQACGGLLEQQQETHPDSNEMKT